MEENPSEAVVVVGPAGLGEERAVDAESLAADERSLVTQKEFHGGGDVVRGPDAAKGSET
jgi:hypothetical protein